MNKVIPMILLFAVSSSIYGGAQEALLTKEEINELCKIDENSIEYSKSGFPFMVDKYSVRIDDKKCNIKINHHIHDFSLQSEALIKLHEQVAVNKSLGIPLEPNNGDPNYYTWESGGGKLSIIRLKNNYLLSVAANVEIELYLRIRDLILAKYDKL